MFFYRCPIRDQAQVNYTASRYNKESGKFKPIFDFTLVMVAIILSLVFTQRTEIVKEGSR